MTAAVLRAGWRTALAVGGRLRGVETFFHRHRRRLAWVHAAMMVGFLALLLVPPLMPLPAESDGPFDSYRLFANMVLWGVWFPMVFASVVVTGRSWCGLFCPMGAASEWANRQGLQRAIPAWVQWPGTPVVSFVVVTIWAQTLGARDHAESAAILFGGTMALAVAIGFVYGRNKRAWCRHMCPIGLLLGVYARLGAIDFRPKRRRDGPETWTEATVCPTLIDLRHKSESRHCIECFRCVNPQARGGLEVVARRPGTEIEHIRHANANLSEVLFLFLGAGVALGGFLWLVLGGYQDFRLWAATTAIKAGWTWVGEPGPSVLMAVFPERREVFRWVDFLTIAAFMAGWMVLTTAVLSLATAAAARLSGAFGGRGRFGTRFVELGYQFAPVTGVSLLLGLGGELFESLAAVGLAARHVTAFEVALLAIGTLWSLWLGDRLLAGQGLTPLRRVPPLLCGAAGTAFLGAAWYIALFGS